jgi:hypothetical protein
MASTNYAAVDNPRASVYSTDLNDYYDGAAIPAVSCDIKARTAR